MKSQRILKAFFVTLFAFFLINGCSNRDGESTFKETQIFFLKSSKYNWDNKLVKVSFEDDFDDFKTLNVVSNSGVKMGYKLTDNNIKQGFSVRFKIIDSDNKSEYINEIMIEPFKLKTGKNNLILGYHNNTPTILN